MRESFLPVSLSILGFMLALIWGEPLLRVLRHYNIGKLVRIEEPTHHGVKMGTPTMGGVLIIFPVLLLTLLLNAVAVFGLKITGRSVLLPIMVMLGFGLLGAIDDWEGIRGPRRGLGMRARTKFILQLVLALIAALSLKYVLNVPELFWFVGTGEIELGIWYIPIAMFIIVGGSNAINFTDGLDGLAGLISATAFAAYGTIAIVQGQTFLGQFCFSLVGALFGFLWFNAHPAKLFMGDCGALSLGATLGVVALMTGQWLYLPLIAIIPVAEALSVIIQVTYFKSTKGKRIFKMAPLHCHFELLGWSETQVVQRFWLISLMFAMLAVGFAIS